MPAVFAHTLAAKSDALEDVARLAQLGEVITDDNQLPAYGPARYRLSFVPQTLTDANLDLLRRVRAQRSAR